MTFVLFTVVTLTTYFAPSLIASLRGHSRSMAILVLNVLFGWTYLGWISAYAWSRMKPNG